MISTSMREAWKEEVLPCLATFLFIVLQILAFVMLVFTIAIGVMSVVNTIGLFTWHGTLFFIVDHPYLFYIFGTIWMILAAVVIYVSNIVDCEELAWVPLIFAPAFTPLAVIAVCVVPIFRFIHSIIRKERVSVTV